MSLENHDRSFSGIKDIFSKSVVSPKKDRTGRKSAPPFSLRLTIDERACLNEQAGSQPLWAYIRSRLFVKDTEKRRPIRRPSLDHHKLALVLSELGRSRLASNMNQLAKAANIGTLDLKIYGTIGSKPKNHAVSRCRLKSGKSIKRLSSCSSAL